MPAGKVAPHNTRTNITISKELKAKLEEISKELGENYDSMEAVIETRKQARADKNWDLADKIRVALDKVGIVLKDSKEGTTWEVK